MMRNIARAFVLVFSIIFIVSCSDKNSSTVNFTSKELAEAAQNAGEFPSMIEFDSNEELLEYYNISADDVTDSYALRQMMAVDVNEIAVFKVKKGKSSRVREFLNAHVTVLKEKSAFYPEQVESVNGSKIGSQGDYVYLIVHKDGGDIVSALDEKIKGQ